LASSDSLGTVRLWDLDSGQQRVSLKGHPNRILALAFFPDGKTLATGSQDMTIKLWDLATGQERVTLKGHKAAVSCLAIAPDGNLLVSGSDDGTIKLWRAATDEEATALKADVDPDDPVSPVAQNNMGDRLRAEGRSKEAEAAYQRASARLEKLTAAFPDVPAYREELARSYLMLAQTYAQQKQPEDAFAEFSKFVALTPDEAEGYRQRSLLYETLDQWDQAAAELSKVIELQPASPEPRLKRAEFYARRGRWEQAADDFAKASVLSPDQVHVQYWHALARLGASDLAGYRATCADLLERFGSTDKPDVVHWVPWTCILAPDAMKDLHQPVQIAERAVRADPKNISHTTTLGASLHRAGRFAEALKQLKEASAAGERGESGSPGISPAYTWFFLAMANYRLGQAEEARKWLDKAVKQMEQETQNTGVLWNRRLTLHLFRREAENLLHGPARPNEKSE
jgi:tetratricopeptide (TPR) repeat protein